jgi:PAS domain S-box-containing protein
MISKSPHYEALFNFAIDGIIIINNRGVIVEINPAALELFQYHIDELVGKNISYLMPSPDKEKHDSYINNYKETRKPKIIGIGRNVEGLKKDGTIFPFRLAVTEIQNQVEQMFAGTIHDLTKEKEIENKLLEYTANLELMVKERTIELENSQRLYLEIAKNFPNGTVSILDKELNILFTEGKEWIKRDIEPSQLKGKSFLGSIVIRDNQFVNKLSKVLKGENVTLSYSSLDNFYELIATPIKLNSSTNKVQEILVVEKNTTEQKEAELEITNALEKEKTLHEMKSRFVSMASHEFRTPLSTILSSAILLGKYPSYQPEKSEKHLQRIRSNVQNLNQILEDFLSIDRINTGELKAINSKFDLCSLVPEVIEQMESILGEDRSIIVKVPNERVEVHLDKQLMRNVLINILSNAIKYSEEDILLEIKMKKKLTITIQDYGIGIPKKEREQLFQRFFRAENAINIQGTGLGLHIVKRYLDLMNGNINIESEVNKGTSVQLSFKDY